MRFRWVLLAVLMVASVCRAENVDLTVLQSTDIHGSDKIVNYAAWIGQERKTDPELLLIDCGDLTRGTFETSIDGGASMVSVLNACKYDVWVPGNHEFRIGQKNFRRDLDLFSSGEVLAANLVFEDPAAAPKRAVLPWKMFERKGLKIAVIGITKPFADEWFGSAPYAGIKLLSPADVLPAVFEEIRKAKPDLVFLAAHYGAKMIVETETGKDKYVKFSEILKKYPEISLVLGGHSHATVPAQELYPGTWEVQAPALGKGLAKITVTYNKDQKQVEKVTSVNLVPEDIEPLAHMPADWIANNLKADAARKEVLVRLPEDMKLGPAPKGTSSELGQLIARSMVEETGADAAVSQTYSGWRNKSRELTAVDFFSMMSNEYYITLLTLTPEQLKVVFKEMGGVTGRSFGVDENELPDKPITVAFDAYDVTGCDGAYPELRKMALSGEVNRRDPDLTIRDTIRSLLTRLYPAK